MKEFQLTGKNLTKSFSNDTIFSDLSLSLSNGTVLAVTGKNGSGKSTLLKILATVLKPNSGTLELLIDNKAIKNESIISHIGFVAPYLNLYEEFTPVDLFRIFSKIRNKKFDEDQTKDLLKRFELFDRRRDQIYKFSSGMKQRVKYILALINDPFILFLDEPSTNLDESGISMAADIIDDFKSSNKAVIIASNDKNEIALSTNSISIMDYK